MTSIEPMWWLPGVLGGLAGAFAAARAARQLPYATAWAVSLCAVVGGAAGLVVVWWLVAAWDGRLTYGAARRANAGPSAHARARAAPTRA
jgi:hypothetical protein